MSRQPSPAFSPVRTSGKLSSKWRNVLALEASYPLAATSTCAVACTRGTTSLARSNSQGHTFQVIQVPPEAYDNFFPSADEMRVMVQYWEQYTYARSGKRKERQ